MSAHVSMDALLSYVPRAFRRSEDVHPGLAAWAKDVMGPPAAREIGSSVEGRPIHGFIIGGGPLRVSMIAGSHADEPVGPETLRCFVEWLLNGETRSVRCSSGSRSS
jgi:hypothetical protein